MSEIWVTADLHLGHLGVCKFTKDDGVTKLRPWSDPAEMDEALIKMWNERVGPKDRVNVLGDVVINRRCLPTLARLNGRKRLVSGNHDIFRLDDYRKYFDDITGYHVLDGIIMSHIPVHPSALARFGCNVHGHLHARRVLTDAGEIDPRYLCVSLEQTHFAPVTMDEVKRRIVAQGGVAGFKDRVVIPADAEIAASLATIPEDQNDR